jgi:hypothetical protein
MLPTGPQLQSQKVALSRLKKVCQAVLGKTDPNQVARNSEPYFWACYKNFNDIMQFSDTWSVSYIYDQLHKPSNAAAFKNALQSPPFDIENAAPIAPWKSMVFAAAEDKQRQAKVVPAQQKQLPAEYTVPSYNLRDMWDCWFNGNEQSPPLKDIQVAVCTWKLYAMDRTTSKNNVNYLYKCAFCIKALNPHPVICDKCIIHSSEKYFNEGMLRLQILYDAQYSSSNLRTLMVSTVYEKLFRIMGSQKRQRSASNGIDSSGSDGEDTPAVHALVIPVAMRSAIATSNPKPQPTS